MIVRYEFLSSIRSLGSQEAWNTIWCDLDLDLFGGLPALAQMRFAKRLIPSDLISNMAVPRMSQLRQGTAVNIVLKVDQPSGKLTTGTIADFLTRGDHPRGIKVRLSDGQIGRVQSMASGTQSPAPSAENIPFQTRRAGAAAGYGLQQDYRTEEQPEEDVSLLDYIKVQPAKKSKGKRKVAESSIEAEPLQGPSGSETAALQQQMESEFPNLDPALIAAIMSDHGSPAAARGVLAGLG